MFDHLLESSHRDDSNKWSNIGISKEIIQVESISQRSASFLQKIFVRGILFKVDLLTLKKAGLSLLFEPFL